MRELTLVMHKENCIESIYRIKLKLEVDQSGLIGFQGELFVFTLYSKTDSVTSFVR